MILKSATILKKKNGGLAIKVTFPFDRALINTVKTFANYSYSQANKYWRVPLTLSNVKKLQSHNFVIQAPLADWCRTELERDLEREAVDVIPGFKGIPKPFQKTGVAHVDRRNGRALIADEMGLGKTIQGLAWLQLHPEARPAVIVVPSIVKINWAREAHRFMTRPHIRILSGETPYELESGGLFIINHDILIHWLNELIRLNPKVIIIDEVHYYNSNKTLRYKAMTKLLKNVINRIGLSGTPLLNYPIEVYYIWKLLDPATCPNYPYFVRTFCKDPKWKGYGPNDRGAINLDLLYQMLTETLMIRRLKKDVMAELPPITYSIIPFEITNRKEYDRASTDFVQFYVDRVLTELEELNTKVQRTVKGTHKSSNLKQLDLFEDYITDAIRLDVENASIDKVLSAEPLMKFGALRRLAAEGKIQPSILWIKEFLLTGKKLIVFAEHRDTLQRLHDAFPKISVKVDGSVTGVKRQRMVDDFQKNPKIKLFIANEAAQEGLTLTAASDVVHVEFPWNPGAVDQRNARAHRMTQEGAVMVYYMVAVGTVDEDIAALIDLKREISDGSLDNVKTNEIHILKKLLTKLKGGKK